MKPLVLASLQDLSGPARQVSEQVAAGMALAVEHCNRDGGIAQSSVRLVIGDHGFDRARASSRAEAICSTDVPVAFVGNIGSMPNLAIAPILEAAGIANLFPLAAASALYEPVNPLRFASTPCYRLQMHAASRFICEEFDAQRIGAVIQDDPFGDEVLAGTAAGLAEAGRTLDATVRIEIGQADLSGALDAIESARCDWVLLGTMLEDTVRLLREARQRGQHTRFLGSISTYTELLQCKGSEAAEGFWSVATTEIPHPATSNAALLGWQASYERAAGDFPGAYSLHGYLAMRHALTGAARVRGEVTSASLCKTLEDTVLDGAPFGADSLRFSPSDHLGSRRIQLARVQRGRWSTCTGFIGPQV